MVSKRDGRRIYQKLRKVSQKFDLFPKSSELTFFEVTEAVVVVGEVIVGMASPFPL